MDRVWSIAQKELAQAVRTRMAVFTLVFTTLIFTLIPLALIYAGPALGSAAFNTPLDPQVLATLRAANPALHDLPTSQLVLGLLVASLQSLFLVIPVITPRILAVYSIIGEKQTHSLEALLATPVETRELLAGKCLAAAIPGIGSTWVSYLLFLGLAAPGLPGAVVHDILLQPAWLLVRILLVLAAAVMAVLAGLIVSSRASDPQSAQQLGSIVVLPVILLLVGQVSGVVRLNLLLAGVGALALLALDAGLLAVAVRLFQRETILTRWK